MDTHTTNTWWDSYRKTLKISRRFRELVNLLGDREDLARNMIDLAKEEYPGKSEIWYLDTLITEVKTQNNISFA